MMLLGSSFTNNSYDDFHRYLTFHSLFALLLLCVFYWLNEDSYDSIMIVIAVIPSGDTITWAAPSEFGTYRLCEQRRFRRACASAQSRQNLRCSLIQAVSQEEPSDRKPDPWPLWMAGHAQLKFVMTECSKTQIRLARLTWYPLRSCNVFVWNGILHPKDVLFFSLTDALLMNKNL